MSFWMLGNEVCWEIKDEELKGIQSDDDNGSMSPRMLMEINVHKQILTGYQQQNRLMVSVQ